MPTKSRRQTERYSRPPSLSTIDSNEELDFSSNRYTHRTQHSAYSIPLYLDNGASHATLVSAHNNYNTYPLNNTQHDPIDSPAGKRETIIDHQHINELMGVSNEDKQFLEHPVQAHTRSSILQVPMARTNTMMSMSDDGSTPGVKYMKTRYMWMLLQLDQVPWWHNTLAAASAWIVLAAYLVVPGTFTTLSTKSAMSAPTDAGQSQLDSFEKSLFDSINNLGLLALSGVLAGIGALNCIVLFYMHWQNYIWLSWKIFQPMMLNAFAGLLTTIVNVYTAQKGVWSITAKINASVTGSVAGVASLLFILYNFWLLDDVKKRHREVFPVDAELVDPMKTNKLQRFLPRHS